MAQNPEWMTVGDGFTDIKLSKPLSVNGTKVDSLRMREPRVRDQEATQSMDASVATREIIEFANLCDISPEDLRDMCLRDYRRLSVVYVAFHN